MPTHFVTGATDGIGFATALQLSFRDLRVVIHGRTQASAMKAWAALRQRNPRGTFVPVWADFARLSEVRNLLAF